MSDIQERMEEFRVIWFDGKKLMKPPFAQSLLKTSQCSV